MNIEDVDLFLELCKNRNISVTANNLFFAQTTVSRRLTLLEKELGYLLFTRGKGCGTIALTPAGKRFFVIAQQISLLNKEAHSLYTYADMQHLSIGSTDSIASYPLRDFFHKISREQKNWDIDIAIHDSLEIYEMVFNRTIDIGITNGPSPLPELLSIQIFEEDFVVVRRGEHNSKCTTVHPRDLKESHEIFQIFSDEYHYWHNSWWTSGIPKGRVNFAHFTVGFLNDPEDWAILPFSVAQSLLPKDGYLSYLLESPPKRRCFLILHKKLRSDRQDIIHEFQIQLNEYIKDIADYKASF